MFGLIRFSTIAHKLLGEILRHARAAENARVHERRQAEQAALKQFVSTLALLTPRGKEQWIVQQLKQICDDEPEGLAHDNLYFELQSLKYQLRR
jgi:hypothetical protein